MLKLASDIAPSDDSDAAPSLERKQYSYKECNHKTAIIDSVLRVATCSRCGEKLDPIEVLLNMHNWIKTQEAHFKFIQDWKASRIKEQQEKDANRRTLCRRCRHYFIEQPEAGGVFRHCGICNPCWESKPMHIPADYGHAAPCSPREPKPTRPRRGGAA